MKFGKVTFCAHVLSHSSKVLIQRGKFNQMLTNWSRSMNYVTHKTFCYDFFADERFVEGKFTLCVRTCGKIPEICPLLWPLISEMDSEKCIRTKRKSHFFRHRFDFFSVFPSVRSLLLSSLILKGKINFPFSFFFLFRSC